MLLQPHRLSLTHMGPLVTLVIARGIVTVSRLAFNSPLDG